MTAASLNSWEVSNPEAPMDDSPAAGAKQAIREGALPMIVRRSNEGPLTGSRFACIIMRYGISSYASCPAQGSAHSEGCRDPDAGGGHGSF